MKRKYLRSLKILSDKYHVKYTFINEFNHLQFYEPIMTIGDSKY